MTNSLYKVEFTKDKIILHPKTFARKVEHWASDASKNTFNKLIPTVKSLLKDMYSVLENIYKSQTGEFKDLNERKYLNTLKNFS